MACPYKFIVSRPIRTGLVMNLSKRKSWNILFLFFPSFGLYPFQNPTARDYVISGLIESGKDLSTVDGIPWHSVLPKEEKV